MCAGTSEPCSYVCGRPPSAFSECVRKRHLLVDATGIPLAWTVTGGNRNDVTQLIPLVDRVPRAIRDIAGRRGRVGRTDEHT